MIGLKKKKGEKKGENKKNNTDNIAQGKYNNFLPVIIINFKFVFF
jgi:hypothetical protein